MTGNRLRTGTLMSWRTRDWRLSVLAIVVGGMTAGGAVPALGHEGTITIHLPGVGGAPADSITIPDDRPIYAILVSGYERNGDFDEIHFYNFAKFLMQRGAYVHVAWWNNLLAPYMARPLHQSDSSPGDIVTDIGGFVPVPGLDGQFSEKAIPEDDFQFQADARAMVRAIRSHNPSAIIILAGHSMGGGAVARFGAQIDVVVDLLAPIDPVENRSKPVGRAGTKEYNWTRWRVTREGFLGYKTRDCRDRNLVGICTCAKDFTGMCEDQSECIGVGDWEDVPPLIGLYPATLAPVACPGPHVHNPPRRRFGSNIVHLYHRYQKEALFPFDFLADEFFVHTPPPGGSSSQAAVDTCALGVDPIDGSLCAPDDGHGEIVGYRGVVPQPRGVRMRNWPPPGDVAGRESLFKQIPSSPSNWSHQPENPDLCLVSPGLIVLVAGMNLPPHADAGPDQELECEGVLTEVTLDGSMSSDPDGDVLTFTWTGPFGTAEGEVVTVELPVGTHEITLNVDDGRGRFDVDTTVVTIQDTGAPELHVTLVPDRLWPPNHQLVEIEAVIEAHDCSGIEAVELVSITSNEPDDGPGQGKHADDIQGADLLTDDRSFYLRAERSGRGTGRVYTVTYRATDITGLATETTAEVVVPHDQLPPPGGPGNKGRGRSPGH